MTRHSTDDDLLDLLEADGPGAARAHAGQCAACSARLSVLRDTLRLTRGAELPEPSPLYWQAFRRNVERRIAAEPRASRLRAWLVPLVATAAVVALVAMRPPRAAAPAGPTLAAITPAAVVPAWSALPPAEEDAAIPVLEGFLVADGATGWDEGRGLGAFEASLSDEESQLLADTLRRSIGGDL